MQTSTEKSKELQSSQNCIKLVKSNRLIDYIYKYLQVIQRKIEKHSRKLRNVQSKELSCLNKEKKH